MSPAARSAPCSPAGAADLRLRLSAKESEARSRANQGLRLAARDMILLCSDGLTKHVDPETIALVLSEEPTAEAACCALVDMANERAGLPSVLRLPRSLSGLLRMEALEHALASGPR